MTNNNYDNYVSHFEALANKADYTRGSAEMNDMFLEGLPTNILYDTLKPPTPTTYEGLKDRVRSLAQGKAIIDGLLRQQGGGTQGGGNAYQWINNNQWCPFHRTTGEVHLGDKEEEDDLNIILWMLHPPWTTHPSPWIYLGAVPLLTGKGEETKGTGGNQDHKDNWPKDLETLIMHASMVDKLDTMLGTAPRDEDKTPSPTSLTLTMRNQKKLLKIG